MKKIFIGFLISVLCLSWAKAQSVDNYKFVSSTGNSYTALSGGTALTQIPSEGNVADFVYNADMKVAVLEDQPEENLKITGMNIGFDFMLGGETYNTFAVTGYGYLLLGKTGEDITFSGWNFFMNRMDGVSTAIGIATDAPVYGLKASYKLEGTSGSRVLTVEFANISYESAEATDRMAYQIKLYEAEGRVDMLFAGYKALENFVGSRFNVGLVASGNTHFRDPGSDWVTTEYGFSTTSARWTLPAFPAGLLYTFSLPEPCATPTYKITELKLTPKSDEIAIDIYIDTTGKAEGYLLFVSEQPLTGSPEGLNFIKNQQALGGTVLAVGELSEFNPNRLNPDRSKAHIYFTHSGLQPNTHYVYTAYLANTQRCLARYTEPVSQKISTATTAPAELTATLSTSGDLSFSAKANDLGEEIAILMTTGQGTDQNNNRVYVGNYAGIPADAQVGDLYTTSYTFQGNVTIDTTYVLYQGPAQEDIKVPVDLKSNRIYYFGAVSKGKESGFYSSVAAEAAPMLTPATLPFSDNFASNFTLAEDHPFIGGWASTQNFEVSSSSRNIDGVVTNFVKGELGQAKLVMPALDFPADSNVLVNINYSLEPYSYNSSKVAGDSICIEISTDGGNTFKTLKAVHGETDNLTLGKVILSDYLGVKQAVLRLRVVYANPDAVWNVKVSSIKITALPFCPDPGAARESSTYGGTLGLTWNAGENGETQWNISTAPAVTEGESLTWNRPTMVEEKPYYLSGLGDRETYHVRVQAVCAGGRTSGWVESTVTSGRVPTFTEDFDNLPMGEDYYGDLKPELPLLWQDGYAYWYKPYGGGDSYWNISMYSGQAKFLEYKKSDAITAESDYNGSIAYDMQYTYNNQGYRYFLMTPVVELNAAEQPKFVFNVAYGKLVDNILTKAEVKQNQQMVLWICDHGRMGSILDSTPIKTWTAAELVEMNEGETIEVGLAEYLTKYDDGIVSLCLGLSTEPEAPAGQYMLYLDNIGFVNTLPQARSVKVTSLSGTVATIRWVADKTVEKWLVKLTGETLTAPVFYETVGNTQVLEGLEPETAYTVAVSHLYANNGKTDTAAWNSVTFTTPGLTCDEPTALQVSEISRKGAVLTWQGAAADGYRVRYRPVAKAGVPAMEWVEVEVSGTTYTLNGLSLETEYEAGVQSVCNKIAGLESDFVAFDNFSTLALTCFAPTELRIGHLGTKTTTVSWQGTSDAYQVAWTVQGANDWKYGDVVAETSYTITGLAYDRGYTFRVRGVCAAGDSSEWSETRNFRTGSRPACPNPANLRVEALTHQSATLLWDAEEAEEGDIQAYILRHRAASVQAWDSIFDIKEKTYAITGMEPKTAYVWAVMTACIDDRYSENWAQLRFETPGDSTGIEDLTAKSGLYVAAAQGQISVLNPQAVRIDAIRIYSTAGVRLGKYDIRSNDHVLLTTGVHQCVAVVEIESAGRFFRFKVLLP